MADLESLIAGWDGTAVLQGYHAPTSTSLFIALHDATLGTPAGGTRMKVYPRPADGLIDAQRLAAGMTHKWATIGVPFGGGKAVIALSRELLPGEREEVLGRYAQLLALVRTGFLTGQDLGTTPEDMGFLAHATDSVLGVDPETGTIQDPGPFTALGVFVSMRAACEASFDSPELAGRSVLIQGVGDVGEPLAELLAEAGAEVLISDLDSSRAEGLAKRLGGRVVAPGAALETACDIYAPCAIGATVNAQTIPRLGSRIVAGSANNQLAEEQDAARLHEQGILYAPDYVVNAGGAVAFSLIAGGVLEEDLLRERVEGLFDVTLEILRESSERNESPLASARRRVERALAAGR